MERIHRSVRAFPILPGKEQEARELAAEMKRRRARTKAFYGKYGIVRESWHLQRTAAGTIVIGVTEAPRLRKVAKRYGASADEMETWFKGRIRELTGIDPDREPLGPPTETLLDWSA
jgi:hypothetical protein